MEIKWIVIGVVCVFACMSIGMGLQQYENHQCRMEAIKALVSPEAIPNLCK